MIPSVIPDWLKDLWQRELFNYRHSDLIYRKSIQIQYDVKTSKRLDGFR